MAIASPSSNRRITFNLFFTLFYNIFQKRALQQEKCEQQMEKVRFPVLEEIKFSKAKVTLVKLLANKWISLSPQPPWKLKAHS